ncbi:hypothetical protein P7K49_034308 [Saguinus oedipus]|uniref:Uncharacterized protein n=1 Tax=Saguinus oedipus TaxID=9490 RepID=A0ABQ9TUW1_SAGOE|nr:hypothetical protein P7K49_034308 [Saguinus oedipus]
MGTGVGESPGYSLGIQHGGSSNRDGGGAKELKEARGRGVPGGASRPRATAGSSQGLVVGLVLAAGRHFREEGAGPPGSKFTGGGQGRFRGVGGVVELGGECKV